MNKVQASLTEKIFALAMVCSIMTQLRVASVVGISEVLILLLGVFGRYRADGEIGAYHVRQDNYIKVIGAIIPLGLIWNYFTQNNFFEMAHDLFAFGFVAFLIFAVLDRLKLYQNVLGVLYAFFLFETLANLMYFAMYTSGMGMYYEVRFEGFSSDPNQLAEVLLLIPWLGIYFLRQIKRQRPRNGLFCALVCLACCVSSVMVGMLTQSDSFVLSSVAAIAVYLAIETVQILFRGRGNRLVLLIDGAIILYLIVGWSKVQAFVSNYLTATAGDANQLLTRQKLWLHGFQAFLNSPLVGNGPGAYSGNWWAFGNFESHNTYIYILMDFGVIGFFMLLGILCSAWRQTRRAASAELSAAFVSLLVFLWFHSFHRMPLFWFYLYLFHAAGIREELGHQPHMGG